MYHQGQGVPQDYVQAHMWLNLASANGSAHAVEVRDTVARSMTPDQIAEAQRLAREWRPKNASHFAGRQIQGLTLDERTRN